jgi:hypothetical protein
MIKFQNRIGDWVIFINLYIYTKNLAKFMKKGFKLLKIC